MPEPPSYCTVHSGSDLDASRYTCLSPGQVYTYPVSSNSTLQPEATAAAHDGSASSATMAGVPSLPSYSTAGPSTSLDPASDPSSSGGPTEATLSADSHVSWPDMGPYNVGDVVDPIFEELHSFKNLVQLRHAQWFLSHFLIRHESLSHQLLIVSTIKLHAYFLKKWFI